jgi:phage gp29-like protein
MLIPYALAIGCTLALFGLFCEMAQHFNWTRRQKGWGGLLVGIGAMGVVPFMAEQMNQLAMAATCSCLVLALSIRNNQGVVRAQVVATEPISGLTFALEPAAPERLEPQAVVHVTAAEDVAIIEEFIMDAEDAGVEEAEAIEENVAVEEAEVIEEVIAVEEAEAIEEVIAVEQTEATEEVLASVEEAVIFSDDDLDEEEVSAENLGAWLNAKIASAYEAKASGAYEQAYRSFKQAVRRADDAELSAMLQEEMADCSRYVTQDGQDKLLQAS